jgi:hypothetical protein
MTRRWQRRLCFMAGAFAFLNFAIFFAGILLLGGDAANGGVQNGRYYLNSHGAYTEVSRGVYMHSWWHELSRPFTFALFAFVAYFVRTGGLTCSRQDVKG